MTALLRADALYKAFSAEQPAVDGLSFSVAAGEIYGLIGPNGAGKTTTHRILSGLMIPDGGAASICGHDVVEATLSAKANVGFLTGSTGLYGRLTVREVLRYFGRLHGVARSEIVARTAQFAGQLQIEHLLDRRCEGLSTGERQRASLARAMIHRPQVLILDEPTAGLDVLASTFVADFIREAKAEGRAILFSTHYMTEAELLCDRVGLLYRGRLMAEGPPRSLRGGESSLEEVFLAMVAEVESELEPGTGAGTGTGADPDDRGGS